MKVLLLSELRSTHTLKWARALAERGIKVLVFGLSDIRETDYVKKSDYEVDNIEVYSVESETGSGKWQYFKAIRRLKKAISVFKPDLIHAHYATSYGLLGRLSGFKPFILSVWGSDVFEFPKVSFIHKRVLERNLATATVVLSTSHAMLRETAKYIKNRTQIKVTPFGIDMQKFKPSHKKEAGPQPLVIGTIKVLSWNYGIDTLVTAFHLLKKKHPELPLRLVIGGVGPEEINLREMAARFGLTKQIDFIGRIDHANVPSVLNTFDIFAALSRNESFGVSVIEACACQLPVVVSDAPGLVEVVESEITGLVVKREDAEATANALEKLVLDGRLRQQLGLAGRERVTKLYDWHKNVDLMCTIYDETIRNHK